MRNSIGSWPGTKKARERIRSVWLEVRQEPIVHCDTDEVKLKC